jgi:hypothetical protein
MVPLPLASSHSSTIQGSGVCVAFISDDYRNVVYDFDVPGFSSHDASRLSLSVSRFDWHVALDAGNDQALALPVNGEAVGSGC